MIVCGCVCGGGGVVVVVSVGYYAVWRCMVLLWLWLFSVDVDGSAALVLVRCIQMWGSCVMVGDAVGISNVIRVGWVNHTKNSIHQEQQCNHDTE